MFDQIINVEDIKEEDFILHTELQLYGKDKSNPILFYQIKNINNYDLIYYIGDSVSDMELVFNAKKVLSVESIHFLGCSTDDKKNEIMIKAEKFEPIKTFELAEDVCSYLLK